MRVTNDMIRPELRCQGVLMRRLLPSFSERLFLMAKGGMKILTGKCKSKLKYEQVYLSREDGSKLRLCVYSPLAAKKDVPGLLWLHGGGYGLGSPEQDEAFIKRFIEETGCVVVSPDYRLSVEAPYPAALEDCYAALLWLKERSATLGVRCDQLMIGGDSAGGGLTVALSLYARDKGQVAIAFQMPLYPMIDDRMNTLSARDNDAPIWNAKSNRVGWKLYLGDLYGKEEVPCYAAPARATDYHGLPPTCTYVGSIEPFCDETIAYVENLKNAGVPVVFKLFDGCFHGFDIVCAQSEVAREAHTFLINQFKYAIAHYVAKQPH